MSNELLENEALQQQVFRLQQELADLKQQWQQAQTEASDQTMREIGRTKELEKMVQGMREALDEIATTGGARSMGNALNGLRKAGLR